MNKKKPNPKLPTLCLKAILSDELVNLSRFYLRPINFRVISYFWRSLYEAGHKKRQSGIKKKNPPEITRTKEGATHKYFLYEIITEEEVER